MQDVNCPFFVLITFVMKLNLTRNIQALTASNELLGWVDGKPQVTNIEPIMMKLLAHLVEKRGEVCSNEELIDSVWDGNLRVGKSALRKNIYKLRKLLEHFGEEQLIETIPKKGYRFAGVRAERNRSININWVILVIIIAFSMIVLKIIYPGLVHRLLH